MQQAWQRAQEKLKLWEVCAKDEKNGKAYLGTNGEKEGGSVTCTKAQGKCKWYKERKNLQAMKTGTNASGMEETRSYDEKRGKTPLLLKRSVQMMKSGGKHLCHWRETFRWRKGGKTPLLLKRSVQMMKSAGKHHCYWRQPFKWWKAREKTTVSIEEKRSSDEKRGKSVKDSARKSTWGTAT